MYNLYCRKFPNQPSTRRRCPIHGGTPKSFISMGFSIINHPFWDTPMTLEPPRSLEHSTIGEYPRLDLLPFHQSGLSSSLGSQDAEGSRFFLFFGLVQRTVSQNMMVLIQYHPHMLNMCCLQVWEAWHSTSDQMRSLHFFKKGTVISD